MQNNGVKILPNILITGTPGTGKTTFAALLAHQLNASLAGMGIPENIRFRQIELSKVITANHLYDEWDSEMNCSVFNEDKVLDFIEPCMAAGGIILDFHGSDFFPERYFDLVFVLRTENKILYERLKLRNYGEEKIRGNLDCEIFEECKQEALESYNNGIVFELFNNVEDDMNKNLKFCFDLFGSRGTFHHLTNHNH
jgi:adenylate kinase